MVLYHGTTLDVAKKIKREGLIPHRESAFDTGREDYGGARLRDAIGEDEPLVYVTPEKNIARDFAFFRTKYEMAKRGERLSWGPDDVGMIKLSPVTHGNKKPAIVELNIPPDSGIQFEEDIQGGEFQAWDYRGVIPAKYVSKIIPLKFPSEVENVPNLDRE